MAAVSIGQAYAAVEVDLWGAKYETVPQTRSVTQKADAIEGKIEGAESADDLVSAIADAIDLRVKPVEGTKKASTLIKEKWKADELSLPALLGFLDGVRAADHPL